MRPADAGPPLPRLQAVVWDQQQRRGAPLAACLTPARLPGQPHPPAAARMPNRCSAPSAAASEASSGQGNAASGSSRPSSSGIRGSCSSLGATSRPAPLGTKAVLEGGARRVVAGRAPRVGGVHWQAACARSGLAVSQQTL